MTVCEYKSPNRSSGDDYPWVHYASQYLGDYHLQSGAALNLFGGLCRNKSQVNKCSKLRADVFPILFWDCVINILIRIFVKIIRIISQSFVRVSQAGKLFKYQRIVPVACSRVPTTPSVIWSRVTAAGLVISSPGSIWSRKGSGSHRDRMRGRFCPGT